jgi:glucan-binding YG repeat protein
MPAAMPHFAPAAQAGVIAQSEATTGVWKQSDLGWWYLNPDGTHPAGTWKYISGKWYYFGQDGYMATGWRQVDGRWYYMKPSGERKTGWLEYQGKCYFLGDDGAMFCDAITPDGYYVDASGALAMFMVN